MQWFWLLRVLDGVEGNASVKSCLHILTDLWMLVLWQQCRKALPDCLGHQTSAPHLMVMSSRDHAGCMPRPRSLPRLPWAAGLLRAGAVHVGDAAAPAAASVILLGLDSHQAAHRDGTRWGPRVGFLMILQWKAEDGKLLEQVMH